MAKERKKKRKKNCYYSLTHNDIPQTKAVKIHYLSANTTSNLQPMDHGIINISSHCIEKNMRIADKA